jgi:hypothetical protein
MQRLLHACLLLLPIPLLLSACTQQPVSPAALLSDFCAAYGSMPAGQVYRAGAAEWEEGYLSPALIDALFLEDNGENALSLCTDYAIYLSSSFEGGEIAFFTCANRGDAARVADMCGARLSRIRQIKPTAAILQDACVLHRGCTVVLLLLPENNHAKGICERLL